MKASLQVRVLRNQGKQNRRKKKKKMNIVNHTCHNIQNAFCGIEWILTELIKTISSLSRQFYFSYCILKKKIPQSSSILFLLSVKWKQSHGDQKLNSHDIELVSKIQFMH